MTTYPVLRLWSVLAPVICLLLLCSRCQPVTSTKQLDIVKGQCASCHVLPNPESLTSDIWKNDILPHMSFYFSWEGQSDYSYANQNFYRKKAQLPMNDKTWAVIESYYVNNSPQVIPVRQSNKLDLQVFFEEISVNTICHSPSVSALMIDKADNIYCACAHTIMKLNALTQVDTVAVTKSVVSQIKRENEDNLLLLNAGLLGPHDLPKGSINLLNEKTKSESILVDQLYRPVYINQIEDQYIVSEFGHNKGRLSTLNSEKGNRQTAFNLPGAYKTIHADIDGDGQAELLVQFSQSAEGIYKVTLDNGDVDYKRIMSFPPEFGLSDIDTSDMNGDGFLDLIISNGDNADFSYMEKAYHGIRIYMNDQKGHFEEKYFYPMYGASQVKVLDIDGDAKMDIIASSFFPHDIEQSIVLLHQNSHELEFKEYAFENAHTGRWMVMEKGDIDQDGDEDVVIGAFMAGPTTIKTAILQNWVQESVDMLILKNKQIQ